MPDLYCRIQCSTKTITMGALPVLVAIAVAEGPVTPYGSRALLIAVLLLVVNPASSHALARAAYKVGVPMWPGAVRDDAAHMRSETARDDDTAGRHRGSGGTGAARHHPARYGGAQQDTGQRRDADGKGGR